MRPKPVTNSSQNTKKRANLIIPGASLHTPTTMPPTPKQEQTEQTSHTLPIPERYNTKHYPEGQADLSKVKREED